jgi:hypothetical protein
MVVIGGLTSDGTNDPAINAPDLIMYSLNLESFIWTRYYVPADEATTKFTPRPRCHATLVSTPKSLLYYGGYPTAEGCPYEPNFWSVFEIGADACVRQCKTEGHFPLLWGHSAIYAHRCMMLFGGVDGPGCAEVATLCVFHEDERRWRWAEFPFAPDARLLHSAVLYNGRMFVYGGFASHRMIDGSKPQYDDVWAFSLNTGLWERIESTGSCRPRSGHSCVVVHNKMVAFGGLEGNSTVLDGTGTVGILNLETFTWSERSFVLEDLPSDMHGRPVIQPSPSSASSAQFGNLEPSTAVGASESPNRQTGTVSGSRPGARYLRGRATSDPPPAEGGSSNSPSRVRSPNKGRNSPEKGRTSPPAASSSPSVGQRMTVGGRKAGTAGIPRVGSPSGFPPELSQGKLSPPNAALSKSPAGATGIGRSVERTQGRERERVDIPSLGRAGSFNVSAGRQGVAELSRDGVSQLVSESFINPFAGITSPSSTGGVPSLSPNRNENQARNPNLPFGSPQAAAPGDLSGRRGGPPFPSASLGDDEALRPGSAFGALPFRSPSTQTQSVDGSVSRHNQHLRFQPPGNLPYSGAYAPSDLASQSALSEQLDDDERLSNVRLSLVGTHGSPGLQDDEISFTNSSSYGSAAARPSGSGVRQPVSGSRYYPESPGILGASPTSYNSVPAGYGEGAGRMEPLTPSTRVLSFGTSPDLQAQAAYQRRLRLNPAS